MMEWFVNLITQRPVLFARIVLGLVVVFSGVIALLFQKNIKKQNHQIMKTFRVQNQHTSIDPCNELEVRKMILEMFQKPNEFVTLIAPYPINAVSFIQACVHQDQQIEVQIKVDGRLYYKYCSKEETLSIFYDFINETFEYQKQEYQEVTFR